MLTVQVPRIDCAQCLLLAPYKVTVGSTWVIPENALFAERAILPITSLESSHDLLSVRIAFQQSMWPAPAWPSPPPPMFLSTLKEVCPLINSQKKLDRNMCKTSDA